jgi:hypothetical protein
MVHAVHAFRGRPHPAKSSIFKIRHMPGQIRIASVAATQKFGAELTLPYTLLLELRSGGPLRAVDQIEGILNRDRKVATYKLALFRALAEIAMQEPRVVRWTSDARVGVPVSRVAERWLFYYWPIFAAERFVPQSQAEGKGDRNPVAFRAPMRDLMAEFAGQGKFSGLTAWQMAWASGQVAAGTQGRLKLALRSIASTIIDGPVEHSGGSLQTGRVFTYKQTAREVVMAAELWRELTLLGHWIIDAVIVRWAALTERFATQAGHSIGRCSATVAGKACTGARHSNGTANLSVSGRRSLRVDRKASWRPVRGGSRHPVLFVGQQRPMESASGG